MRGLLSLAALLASAGCYSANAQPGSPCSPAAPFCPNGQSCAPFAGGYACLAGAPPLADAATDAPAMMIDAPPPPPIDAPTDAAIDAPPPPWALVQVAVSETATTSMMATAVGDTIIVAFETDGASTVTSVTDDGGNAYTMIPGSRSRSITEGAGVEIWYAPSAHAATTLTATATTLYGTVIWEVAGLRATGVVDAVSKLDDQAASTTPLGAPITTTRDGDFVVSAAMVGNSVQGIHAGNAFTNDRKTQGDGWAHLTSNAAPAGTYQAEWDQPTTAVYCTSSAAFFTGP